MSAQEQVQKRIQFLQTQLESLEHYLPETYQYLMVELDLQKRQLAEIEVLETYQQIESEHECSDPSSRQSRGQCSPFSRSGAPNEKGQGT